MGILARALVTTSLLSAASLAANPIQTSKQFELSKSDNEPCAQVAAAQQEQSKADPEATTYFIPAELAHDCLKTVPFKKNDALRVIDPLSAFWQWQSTIDYLKNPPKGYMMPAVDIDKRLAGIRDKAVADEYGNEFEFQSELQDLAVSTHDAHFNLRLDALKIFEFQRENIGPIVAVSEDGKKFPKIYAYYDLTDSKGKDWEPSPITKIDGKDALEWLTTLSYQGFGHDPDTLFSELFFTMSGETTSSLGNFYSLNGEYTGATTSLGFANGTTNEYDNVAAFKDSFAGVKDGESFYSTFCNGELPDGTLSTKRDLHLASSPRTKILKRDTSDSDPRASYPKSVAGLQSGEVAGYFLEDDDKTAILSASAFTAESGSLQEFSGVIKKFLAECKKKSKEKLIIDMTSNGGGSIFLAYDMVKQLFPNSPFKDSFNIRATEQLSFIGNKIQEVLSDESAIKKAAASGMRGSIFDIKAYVDLDGKPYEAWDDLFGPEANDAGNFTHLARWNFNDRETALGSGGLVVSGYLDRKEVAPQVFKPENIVILTDGNCGSACTIVTNLLKQNGVGSIVTGGRPRDGPVQVAGGVRGTHVLTFQMIHKYASNVMKEFATPQEKRKMDKTDLGGIVRDGPYLLARTYNDGQGARVNIRNRIDVEDKERIPGQFAYEPADCRIWLTREMVLDAQKLWSSVANTVWGDGKCTPGSTGDKN